MPARAHARVLGPVAAVSPLGQRAVQQLAVLLPIVCCRTVPASHRAIAGTCTATMQASGAARCWARVLGAVAAASPVGQHEALVVPSPTARRHTVLARILTAPLLTAYLLWYTHH